MKFLVFSDLHAHSFDKFSKTTKEGKNTRLNVIIQCLENIRALANETGIKDIIFAGDLFDAKNRVPMVVVNEVYRELLNWQRDGLNVLMIPGNHDFALRTGQEHGLTIFSQLKGFTVKEDPAKGVWTLKNGSMIGVCAVPYRERIEREWFEMGTQIPSLNICVAHGLVEGACYHPEGMTLGKDDNIIDHEGVSTKDLILREWLEPYDLSIVGHIHYPQKLGSKKHILIPGMPWNQHPHERNQKRGIWEIEVGSDRKISMKQHVFQNIPSFLEVTLLKNGKMKYKGIDFSADMANGHIVLLEPESIDVRPSVALMARSALYKEGGAFYIEDVKCTTEDSRDQYAARLDVSSIQDPKKVLEKVLKSGLLDLKGEKEEDLLLLGSSILSEVIEEKNMSNQKKLRE